MKNLSNKIKVISAFIGVAGIIGLTGCADGSLGDYSSNAGTGENGYAYSQGVNGSPTFVGSNGTGEQADLANQYYFAFDSSTLSAEAQAELRKHARYLLDNPNSKVRVEGHTDERGSREYNVALGERRAQSVSKALSNDGVLNNQVAVVSYGEEKPAVQGHDESSWKWNRRAKVVYELG